MLELVYPFPEIEPEVATNSGSIGIYMPCPYTIGATAVESVNFRWGFRYDDLKYSPNFYFSSVTTPEPRIARFLAYFYVPFNSTIYFRYSFVYRYGLGEVLGITAPSSIYTVVSGDMVENPTGLQKVDTRSGEQQIADYVYFTTHDENYRAAEEIQRLRNLRERYSE